MSIKSEAVSLQGDPDGPDGHRSGYKVLGGRPIRHDGVDKVTGRAKYGADVSVPGVLYGKVLRSPYAHARIVSVDASEALKLDGVVAVMTARDLPINRDSGIDFTEVLINPQVTAENCLADKKVLYKGHGVAAVAATSQHIAEEALLHIKVDYEVLPPVLDVHHAMSSNAPLIHEHMTTRDQEQRFAKGTDSGLTSNVSSHLQFKRGDVEKGFTEADVIVEREHETKAVHPSYIEPQASTAYWAPDNKVTIWTTTQGHFVIRPVIASVLGLSEERVKVIPTEIGGGFGGKLYVHLEPLCAVLSKKTGHAVKMVMTRREVFEVAGPTSGTYMRTKIGADKNGNITAGSIYLAFEAGAFPGSPVGGAATTAFASYNIDNLLVDALDVVVNMPKIASYRAPGSAQGAFAVETVIDELAEKLGMDPLEFRIKNAVAEGFRLPTGVRLPRVGCLELLETMKGHPHYSAPLPGRNRGRGVAIGFWGNGGGPSSATLAVNSDGTINCVTGSIDIGGTRPSIAMQVAEVLGIRPEEVIPSVGDTEAVGFTNWTGGSRTTYATGIAAITAAQDIRRQVIERAALLWEIQPEMIGFNNGVFTNKADTQKTLTFREMAAYILPTGGPVTASASTSASRAGPAFCGNIVDVEIDGETGKVHVLRYTAFQDVGQAVHPSYVEGQMQGGTAQGIGWALNEEYAWGDDGAMLNASFLDYRMPTSYDLPMIDTVLVEVPNPGHPFGVRGVGEVPITPTLGAMANAVHGATGVRMQKLPMSPGAILEALESSDA